MVGRGAFGIVYKSKWQNNLVAVKYILRKEQRDAFANEVNIHQHCFLIGNFRFIALRYVYFQVRQLSRVSHPNIISIFGACTKAPYVYLVMELAELGSLHFILYDDLKARFTEAHKMSVGPSMC